MTEPEVWLPGSPGRWPFAGHVRGRWLAAAPTWTDRPLGVAWAGRIAGSAAPEEAWEAAEALRAALAAALRGYVVKPGPTAGEPQLGPARATTAAAERIWAQLRELPGPWLAREDLTLLVALRDDRGVWLTGFGLETVLVESGGAWIPAVLAGSPLLGEPGLPPAEVPALPPHRAGTHFLGLPPGIAAPPPESLAAACGVAS